MSVDDEIYMRRCFELARKGLGLTRTNPLVGCVIVQNNRIIGEGYHHEFGGPHAEVNAIRSVKDHSLLTESTLYSNLEPCVHFGKTPPCSVLIHQKGIRRAVISHLDPFTSVNGKGIEQMRDAGVDVTTGCLEEEGYNLNRRFFVYHIKRRPYIILKWAQTSDGYMDVVRDPVGTNWITDEVCRTLVHKWRSEEASILVGTGTIMADNPRLNIRRWTGQQPVRITIDRNGRLFEGAHILDGSQDTIVFTCVPDKYSGKTRSIQVDHDYDLGEALEELHDQQIISLFVEGGSSLLGSFISAGLWDEARVFTGKMAFGQGIQAPEMQITPDEQTVYHGSKLEIFRNDYQDVNSL